MVLHRGTITNFVAFLFPLHARSLDYNTSKGCCDQKTMATDTEQYETTITIRNDLRKELFARKEKGESYDDVLRRILTEDK